MSAEYGQAAISGLRGQQGTKTISVTSGKGGVGKTTLVTNMAIHLSQQGQKVLILDGDIGMANVDIMFGVRSPHSIESVLSGEKLLSEIIVDVAPNISLIPGGSGIYGLKRLDEFQKKSLLDQVNDLEGLYDVMLIDTAPGIDENVLYLNSAAQEIAVILTPDPSSLADAYALIKVLHNECKENKFSLICNQVRDEKEALLMFKRLSDVASKFLCVSLDYKGCVPQDPDLRNATKSQQLILRANPRAISSCAMKSLAEKLNGFAGIEHAKGGMQFFWEQLVGVA